MTTFWTSRDIGRRSEDAHPQAAEAATELGHRDADNSVEMLGGLFLALAVLLVVACAAIVIWLRA